VFEEAGDHQRRANHAGAVVHDDDAASAQHRAGSYQRIMGHGDVHLIGVQHGHRDAAGNDRLDRAPVNWTTCVFIDQLAQADAQWQFKHPRTADVSAYAK